MRLNDIGLLAIVLLAGLLMGVVGTLGVYSSVASHQAEAEQKETEEEIKNLKYERDQLQARIDDFEEADRNKGPAAQPLGGEEPRRAPAAAPQRPPVAAAPKAGSTNKREVVPAPREDRTSAKAGPDPTGGFGPPREFGNK